MRWGSVLRKLAWGGAASLLLMPLAAMQFTREVDWGPGDFIIMGALLAACAGTVHIATRLTEDFGYLAGVVIAVGTSFLLIWINLAVGFVGDDGNPANLMFGGVILIAAIGSAMARFRARGMAGAMLAAAAAEGLIAAITWLRGLAGTEPPGPELTLVLIGLFALPWLAAAALFANAANRDSARTP
jgi:hypothetical protein